MCGTTYQCCNRCHSINSMSDSADSLAAQVLAHRLKEARDRLDHGVAALAASPHLTGAQREQACAALLATWNRERAAAQQHAEELRSAGGLGHDQRDSQQNDTDQTVEEHDNNPS